MKNICIVNSGRFLLGIAEQDILGRMPWGEAVPLLLQNSGAVVQLAALLSRQPGGTPPPDAVCLELRGIFLVVDQIAAVGVELLDPPGPLPPSCPRLAALLCPQVTIWGDTPVLLLDPAQLIPVAEELGEGIGMVTVSEPETASCASPADETEEADEPADNFFAELPEPDQSCLDEQPQPQEAAAAGGEALFADAEAEEASACLDEEKSDLEAEEPQPAPLSSSSQEGQRKEDASIDEETFKKVMSWTVSCFKQRKGEEELRLGIDQLPQDLAALVREKGLSSSIIQYLIDQIVLRCQESAGRNTPGGKKHAG